jgi:hypothetical protein
MGKERNPNFIYVYSEVFQQEYAISRNTGDVVFADGTKYSRKEIDVLARRGTQLTLEEHRVKKIIGGEIVEHGENESGSQGKQPEGNGAGGSGNPAPSGSEVASSPENGTSHESGELDIF